MLLFFKKIKICLNIWHYETKICVKKTSYLSAKTKQKTLMFSAYANISMKCFMLTAFQVSGQVNIDLFRTSCSLGNFPNLSTEFAVLIYFMYLVIYQ